MSQRVKKPGRQPADDSQGKSRRRRRASCSGGEEEDRSGSNSGGNSLTGMWTPRHLNDLKVSSIYNRNSAEAPAELYRKDLISAMKLPDSEPLTPEEYWLITDSWKQEWEKGVQVPVNPESLPEPEVKLIQPVAERSHDFRLPKKKYVRVTHDDFFNPDYHQLVSTAARAEKVCSYDLDDVDAAWLGCSNADRAMQNMTMISEFLMEQVIEELELQCWEQVQTILKSQEGLGIEYDENVICDVCRSPESEEGNEMVFCDSCNICVHQACYGITTIPSGSWLCRTCTLGIKPACVLCPNVGGAMKATRSGHTWAHVACAIWIPEVSIGSVEKMEPITKISSIPQSRWSLNCVLCKEKTGACIQCSVKTCKTAYHVTCAFKNGLEMKPIIVDENAEDGIKLRSYCQKHSVNTKKEKQPPGDGEEEKKKLKQMTAEERNQARAEKLQQIEAEFFKYVRIKDVSQNLAVDMDVVILIYNYWKLKRKSLNNRPLVPPRAETTQLLTQQQEQDLEQMKMFVQLRQDLERVRNLCYMVSRREKLSRSFFRLKEQTFQKQLALLTEPNNLTEEEKTAILAANHGPSIYDQLYSNPPDAGGGKGALPDYESLISMIAGGIEQKKETLMNGIIKGATLPAKKKDDKKPEPIAGTSAQAGSSKDEKNPYKKQFVNGASRRKLLGESSESESEKGKEPGTPAAAVKQTVKVPTPSPQQKGKKKSTVSPPDAKKGKGRKPLEYLFESESSVENATPGKKGKQVASKAGTKKKEKVSQQRNKEKDYSSDSDLELPTTGGKRAPTKDSAVIYTDSDEETDKKELKTPTKKAVKKVKEESPVEVTPPKKGKKVPPVAATTPATPNVPKVTKGKAGGKKGKKSAFDPTELIVPQRMAAKKATESIRTAKKPKEAPKDDEIKEEIQPKEVKKTNQQKVSTLTDSEDEKSTKRKKSVERKTAPSVAPKAKKPADEVEEEEEGEIKDEEEAKNVSYVPQRQAAKKAAEHIRSGLSNIVAARLIIEDEMEATRNKEKKGEGEKSGEGKEEEKISSEVAKKLASKDKPPGAAIAASLKGVRGKGKDGSGTAASSAADAARSATSADWPFLDTGSQSAGRSSRERSSSSGSSSGSSSSSSGSSCSSSRSSSASSSRSSSADSASPEPSPSPPTKVTQGAARSSAILATISQDKVASRKVKTSEPSPQPAAKAGRGAPPSREKPASKGGRPSKSGGGRGVDPFRSAFSPSPEPEPTPTATRNTSTSSSATLRASPAKDVEKQLKATPPEKQRKGRTAAQSPPKSSPVVEKKSTPRRKGEPSPGKRGRPPKSKEATSEEEHSPTKHTPEKRSPPKALTPRQSRQSASPAKVPPTPQTRSGPQLSSESDSECPAKPIPTPKESSLPTITLSDSDSGTEEKENAQRPEPILDSPKKSSSRGGSTPAPPTTSILSPLTPENKEKDSRLSDTEPDSKRPRLESSSPAGAGTSGGGTAHIKSIFSPSSTGAREHDLGLDFDTELYDLAKSVVTEEYRHRTTADDDDSCNEALHFNFTQTLFMQEQNQEESARATLNLVEKLRQQQNMQKFTEPHRPSLDSDGQCDNLDDVKSCSPAGSRPGSSLQGHDVIKVTGSTLVSSPHREIPSLVETRAFSQVTQDKLNASPDRTKQSIEGDERWVPPSGTPRSIPSGPPSHPELGKEDKLSLPLTSPSSYHARSEKGSVMSDSLPSPATPLVASPMVSPLMTSQPQRSSSGSTCSTGLAPPPPPSAFPPNAAAAAAALAVAMAAEASPNNMAAVAAGLPFGAQFMYPALANNPAFASIMAAAAAAAGANPLGAVNPLASFLAKQGPGSPALAYPPFISPVMPPSVPTPQQSPAVPTPPTSQQNHQQQQQPQRRPSDVSPLVSVATSMPPLAKPPLTSPSVLLSTANISSKSQLLSAPPLQSAVAHIIESVVNNHQATSLPKTTLSLDIPLAPPSTNPVPPTPPLPPPTKTPLTSPTPDLLPPKPVETASPQVSPPVVPPPPPPAPSGRGRRASTPRAKASLTGVAAVIEDMLSPPIVSKPSGRRGAKGQSPGRGAKTTPSKRGGASGGRGRGRGKNLVGVRKDLAGTVYDIDFDEFDDPVPEKIDLRSLRERRKSAEVAQQEAKHTPSPLVLTLPVPPSYRQTKEEKRAAKQLEKEKRERERELAKQQKQLEKQAAKAQKQLQKEQMLQQQQQTVAPLKINLTERQSQEEKKEERILEKIPEKVVLPQAPLPGPVDMRTYSGGEAEIKGDHEGITGLPAVEKDPAVDIAQMFMEEATASTTVASKVVTDFDEVDKELQVLMQKPRQVEPEFAKEAEKSVIASKNDEMITGKAPHEMPVAPTAEPTITSQQVSSILNGEPPATMMSHQQQLRPQIMPHIGLPPRIEPPQDNNEDMSRNQLKVKIKGPFLDANYSSTANALPAPGSLPPPFPIQQQPPPVPPGAMAYPPPPFPSQWMMNPSAASSSSNDHPTNLRRMRKKELLRKYWNEDMNMDGGSSSVPPFPPPGPMGGHFHDPVAHHQPSHHPHHPLGRSVITIPKAVASMSILPPQDDHDPGAGDPNEDPLDPSNWKDKDIKQPTQKKRRSRGIYREMAALGILPPDVAPRDERRRDKNATSSPSGSDSNRKRIRESKKPRSTFIPPTLAENVDSPAGAGEGKPITPAGVPPSKDGVSVVNVVNHPTPKLKIKLGELASSGAIQNNTNHSDSDKETPNKKAKGRPPKKRVLSDAPPSQGSSSSSGASSSVAQQMELLKRESMKYREMIMKEYATAEQQEILKLSGTRRGKKKRKGGGGPTESETDDSSVRSKSPAEIKIIDGPKPKLILRFGSKKGKKGKGSEGGSGATSDNSCSSGRTSVQEKISNGLPPKTEEEPTNDTEPATAPKEVNLNNNTVPSGEGSRNGATDKVLIVEVPKEEPKPTGKGPSNLDEASGDGGKPYTPIRLKLSRCSGSYSLKEGAKREEAAGDSTEPPKGGDQCQVR